MNEEVKSRHFIQQIIDEDLASGRCTKVITRFPPEPNGYLHIGHAKAICLDFGMAEEFGGECHLRFDDTNPSAEEVEYVDAIKEDIQWLGFDWGEHLYFASDYFERMYAYAEELIEKGKAYVCTLSPEEFKTYRGVPTRPGLPSPHRDRPIAENLDLFRRMRAGEFPDGAYVLRAKIDMASPNLHLRDPALYRIKHAHHHRTGDAWCLYPMYDWAHGIEDMLEGVTHSLCTLEFEVHRPLYDWLLDQLDVPCHPRQYEFSRLNLTYTIMSKRLLLQLVQEGHVSGWDDPRMLTLCGLRRRGCPAESIRALCAKVGITKFQSLSDVALLEHCMRDTLNRISERRLAVLDPVKLIIENYPEGEEETFEGINNPEDETAGTRPIPFSRELWIDRADFMADPPKKFFRLGPGREVRLRYACLITCTGFETDESGNVTEIRATWDPQSRGGSAPDGRRVKGTIHWLSAPHAKKAELRLYDRLFQVEDPMDCEEGQTFLDHLNPDSLQVTEALVEPSVLEMPSGAHLQFERIGYFYTDPLDHKPSDTAVINRTVPLRDPWRKKQG